MKTDQLTFNDLPAVVGELCDRIASMENLLTEKLSKQHEVKENTHQNSHVAPESYWQATWQTPANRNMTS